MARPTLARLSALCWLHGLFLLAEAAAALVTDLMETPTTMMAMAIDQMTVLASYVGAPQLLFLLRIHGTARAALTLGALRRGQLSSGLVLVPYTWRSATVSGGGLLADLRRGHRWPWSWVLFAEILLVAPALMMLAMPPH